MANIRTPKSRWAVATYPALTEFAGPKVSGWYRWRWQAERALTRLTYPGPMGRYRVLSADEFDRLCSLWTAIKEV